MNWAVKYAVKNINEKQSGLNDGMAVKIVEGNCIVISCDDCPDVRAVICESDYIDLESAKNYIDQYEFVDFLCGYKTSCVWHGDAISYLESRNIGWGNFGALCDGVRDGNANSSTHKTFKFADRIIRQLGKVVSVTREYDRVYTLNLRNGKSFRLSMIADYEPCASPVRDVWERFGPVDAIWNINPNGTPTPEAEEAALSLGCRVVKWDDLKEMINQM